MRKRVSVVPADRTQSTLPLSSDDDTANSVPSEPGTPASGRPSRKREYRLKKLLTGEQVECLQRIIGMTVADFELVKAKKKPADAPREPSGMAFNAFWGVFPRHDAYGAARSEWNKLQPDAATVELILRDVRQRSQSREWQQQGGKWIPFAHTYLKHQRWLDEGVVGQSALVRRTVV